MIMQRMRRIMQTISVLGFFFLFFACQPTEDAVSDSPTGLYRPDKDLGPLFHDVQMAAVFPDSKTFADCDPLQPAEEIAADYQREKDKPGFDLTAFVSRHFRVPAPRGGDYVPDTSKPLELILNEKWDYLTRSPDEQHYGSLIPLPYPYVVPGGRFGEIYYWDSYFTMLGLQVSGRDDLIANMLDNFAYLIDTIGFIPNGNRTYFLSRSQPPFFAAMVNLLAESAGEDAVLKYLPALEGEYAFWMEGAANLSTAKPSHRRVVRLSDGRVLNRYFDDNPEPRPESYKEDVRLAEGLDEVGKKALYNNLRAACESGWDFSSRWFAMEGQLKSIITTEIIPVDLNSLLYNLERTIARLSYASGKQAQGLEFDSLAAVRKQALQALCWDADLGYFVDFHWPSQTRRKVVTAAGMFPFYFQLASADQAAPAASMLQAELLQPGGVRTTAGLPGQQWDAPNGWAPLQWIAINGLRQYKQQRLADDIRSRWLALNERVFKETGKMMEKYNVADLQLKAGGGEYPNQDGFGWSNGVALRLLGEVKK